MQRVRIVVIGAGNRTNKYKKRITLFLAIIIVLVLIPTTFAINSDNVTIYEDSSFLKENLIDNFTVENRICLWKNFVFLWL